MNTHLTCQELLITPSPSLEGYISICPILQALPDARVYTVLVTMNSNISQEAARLVQLHTTYSWTFLNRLAAPPPSRNMVLKSATISSGFSHAAK